MLGIIDHLAAVLHQMGHRIADHRPVFLHRGAQHFGDLHFPALAENGDHRRFRFEQHAHLRILLHRGIGAAGGAEGGEFGVLEFEVLGLAEKFDILRVGARPAAFDVIHAKRIEPARDAQFVEAG